MQQQDRITLGELAQTFNCHWKEVYEAYSDVLKTQEYADFIDRRKPKQFRGDKNEEYNREKDGGSKKEYNAKFLEKHYIISGYRTVVDCYCKIFWK